jgi:hypothetical protein
MIVFFVVLVFGLALGFFYSRATRHFIKNNIARLLTHIFMFFASYCIAIFGWMFALYVFFGDESNYIGFSSASFAGFWIGHFVSWISARRSRSMQSPSTAKQ